jgi:signal transduction histidine kinase/ligand-binding sensor domain-containing protein
MLNYYCFSGYKAYLFVTLIFIFHSCAEQNNSEIKSTNEKEISYLLQKITDSTDVEKHSIPVTWSNQILKDNKAIDFNTEKEGTVNSPQSSTFLLDDIKKISPNIIHLKGENKSFITSMPESMQVREMAAKPQNLSSIAYFDKLQGLKQSFVASLFKDKSGNLWLGTHGGGVTRYDGKYFTHFTEKEGLAGNSVFCIKQLSDDKLWFGTFGKGISIFDGNSFETLSSKIGFPSDKIYTIVQDKNGKIWIGTQGGGLIMIEDSNPKKINQYSTKNGFFSDNILSIIEDKNGGIWVGSEGDGFVKFENNTMMVPSDKNLSKMIITEMTKDANNDIWFSTYGNGLFKMENNNLEQYNEKNGFPSDLLTSVKMDDSGNIWVGSDGKGVIKMESGKSRSYQLKLINAARGLSNDNVYSIVQDKYGSMWFGTNRGGVNKYNGNKFLHIYDGNVFSITEDKSGTVWLATNEDGIVKLVSDSSKTGWDKMSTITTSDGLSSNKVLCSHTDKKDRKWFGTSDGISVIEGNTISTLNSQNGLCGKKVLTILEDKKGLFWFGMADGQGIATYDGKNITCIKALNKKIQSAIFTMAEDKAGRIWIGTESDGIIIWDGVNLYTFDEKLPFNKNAVFSIKVDAVGLIWIGTEGNGIYVYDGKEFYNINEQLGLSNNFVFSILEDKHHDLWFGTRFGLSILDKSKKDKLLTHLKTKSMTPSTDAYFSTYLYEDGFLGVGCNRNAIYQSSDQSVWIGTTDRLTLSSLSKLKKGDDKIEKPLDLFISGLDIFNEKVNWVELTNQNIKSQRLNNGVDIQNVEFSGLTPWYNIPKNIRLKHDNNYLTFYFTAITQDQPWKVKYQYKMDNLDKEWSAWKVDNAAYYNHLPPGKYTLMVRAMDHAGTQSDIVSYSFEIKNPWWFSRWMKMLYVAGISILIYLIHINQKNKTIKNERLKSQSKELEHAKEIAKAYSELKSTQTQLIQSEKMASLGELTAGIAHEIQNPLNFVNNFSEVSNELIDEMNEEFKKGDIEEGMVIANDIKQNLEKINQHGKRASNIVKSMLEHSRKSTGVKEPTDINALCDEYLRLAYHGLRAKEKSFNATIETHFDPTLPKIGVVSQDIGRVVLNLINNAFYAVNERSKNGDRLDSSSEAKDGKKKASHYIPIVSVTTQLTDKNHIQITIRDNGCGIPSHIKDKIFQPFFTTKPTGQGTGLGLSLSFDIVKAHGGELKVESLDGEGTTFIITLPLT